MWSMNASSSRLAPARWMPPPTYNTGDVDSASRSMMRCAVSSSIEGFTRSLVLWSSRSNSSGSISAEKTSIGTFTSTGPGCPDSASAKAFSTISGSNSGVSTRQARFTNGR